jgi:biotin synthase-like enzyme
MKEKSHKGQRHKGCAYCNPSKQSGNSVERRPARDRRQIERAKAEVREG